MINVKKTTQLLVCLCGLVVLGGNSGMAQVAYLDRPVEFDDFVTPELAEQFYVESSSQSEQNLNDLDFSSGRTWKVWCVIEDTPIVSSPGTTDRIDKLAFGVEVVVLELEYLTNGNGAGKNWLKIQTYNGDIGWVPASNMQLASWCLRTKEGVGRKALVVRNLERGAPVNEDLPESQLYTNPSVKRSDKNGGHTAGRFRILYILKESKKSWLVSNAARISMASDIRGWIPKTNMVEWERRLAYAPEFNTDVNERFKDDREIPFFESRSDAERYMRTGISSKSSNSMDILPEDGEAIPNIPAFPFIGESSLDPNDPIRELLLITGSSMTIDNEDLEIMRKVRDYKNKLKNVHIYFIVDATASMKRYYPKIAEVINKFSTFAEAWNAGNNVNIEVGFGVYRDYADAPGYRDVESITRRRFTQDMQNNISRIDCSSKNPKTPEAVYNGIIENIKNFKVNTEASNVFVIIGDEGNHANDAKGLKAQDVSESLDDVNASLFIFQAKSFMTASSNRFQQDGLTWLEKVISENQKLELSHPGVISATTSSTDPISRREAKMIFPSDAPGTPADPQMLGEAIRIDLEAWMEAVINKIDFLQSVLMGDPTTQSPQQLQRAAQAMSDELSIPIEDCINLLTKGGDKAYVRHVSVEKPEESGLAVMKPYIFISFQEYQNITDSFTSLVVKGTSGILPDKKKALYQMCEDLILSQISRQELPPYLQKTMNEIWLEFFQVDCNIPALRDLKIEDILTTNPEGFAEAYDALVRASITWRKLDIARYEWLAGASANDTFYWLPASYFPGFTD